MGFQTIPIWQMLNWRYQRIFTNVVLHVYIMHVGVALIMHILTIIDTNYFPIAVYDMPIFEQYRRFSGDIDKELHTC